MSKCREAFVKAVGCEPEQHPTAWAYWQDAWNARGKVDVAICNNQAEESFRPEQAYFCAEAIEQEQCE